MRAILIMLVLAALTGCISPSGLGYRAAHQARAPLWKTFNVSFPEAIEDHPKIDVLMVQGGETPWAKGQCIIKVKDGGAVELTLYVAPYSTIKKSELAFIDPIPYISLEATYSNGTMGEKAGSTYKSKEKMYSGTSRQKGKFADDIKVQMASGKWTDIQVTEQ
jgi:hypothetical protein